MFTNPLSITYNGAAKALEKVNQDNYAGEYYLDDNTIRFAARIAHTIPSTGSFGESHLLRLDAEVLDATDFTLTRKDSVWLAARTDFGFQNSTSLGYLADALVAFATPANIVKLLGRQT